MTADEMFKELGLIKVKSNKYTQSDIGFDWELVFYSLRKSYEFRQVSYGDDGERYFKSADIPVELHNAISKKVEELELDDWDSI